MKRIQFLTLILLTSAARAQPSPEPTISSPDPATPAAPVTQSADPYQAAVVEPANFVRPPRNVFELGVAVGYSQGGGKIGNAGANLEDISGAGAAAELDLEYRINPIFSLGLYGVYARYSKGDSLPSDTSVTGISAGIQATFHFNAITAVDPWLTVGAGWKGMWLDPQSGTTTSLQGADLARVQIGTDFRLSPSVAIAPVLGASLSMFVAQKSALTMDYDEIEGKKLDITGFAGIKGRFDL